MRSRLLGAVCASVFGFVTLHSYSATVADTVYLDFNELINSNGTATFYVTAGYLQAREEPGLPEFYMNEININANGAVLPKSSESGDWSCYPPASCVLSSPTSPIISDTITDGDVDTGIVLLGGEAINGNGIPIEYPAFAKFTFDLDAGLDSLILNIAASSNVRNGTGGNVWFGFENINTNVFDQFYNNFNADIADGIDTFSITLMNSSVVPIPPAVWLFASGLIGLVGVARRKAA